MHHCAQLVRRRREGLGTLNIGAALPMDASVGGRDGAGGGIPGMPGLGPDPTGPAPRMIGGCVRAANWESPGHLPGQFNYAGGTYMCPFQDASTPTEVSGPARGPGTAVATTTPAWQWALGALAALAVISWVRS